MLKLSLLVTEVVAMASQRICRFTKAAKEAVNFNEADLITCFGNDYGYENWITKL